MSFRFLSWLFVPLLAYSAAVADPLKVCADPNNLPFSNREGEGLENKLAEFIGHGIHRQVEFVWWSERKNFAQHSLDQGACDVVLGVPSTMPGVLTTAAYYRSSYVFVSRSDGDFHIESLNDSHLKDLRIGIHVVGDDYAPPAYALARQGITKNIVGFNLFGEYGEQTPARKIVDAVARGDIDLAIVWGPLAGYFARYSPVPLEIQAVKPQIYLGIPFAFDISAAVRTGNVDLQSELNRILSSQSSVIRRLVGEYGIPQVP